MSLTILGIDVPTGKTHRTGPSDDLVAGNNMIFPKEEDHVLFVNPSTTIGVGGGFLEILGGNGAPGDVANSGGTGGAAQLIAGNGGTGAVGQFSGFGGSATVKAGRAGALGGGNSGGGGNVFVTGGDDTNAGDPDQFGGAVSIQAGLPSGSAVAFNNGIGIGDNLTRLASFINIGHASMHGPIGIQGGTNSNPLVGGVDLRADNTDAAESVQVSLGTRGVKGAIGGFIILGTNSIPGSKRDGSPFGFVVGTTSGIVCYAEYLKIDPAGSAVAVKQAVVWSNTNLVNKPATTNNLTTIAGVALTAGNPGDFILVAKRGRCSVLADAGVAIGQLVGTSAAVAGNVQSGTVPGAGAIMGRATTVTSGGEIICDLVLG